MNVQFDGIGQSTAVDNSRTISYGAAKTSGTDEQSGYSLDISGAVTDNSAYAGHGRTTEDMVCDAMATELVLQSQYLTVMSNSMSEEDFARLSEDGYQPCDTEVGTAVTVVDEIKAVLAEAGVVVSGYNDDLSPEVLEDITGNAGRAQQILRAFHENDIPVTEENVRDVMNAVDSASGLSEPNDGTVKYLVGQGMEPTIENLYVAQHSGSLNEEKQSYGYYDQNGSGYYAKRAEAYDWEALSGQMEKVISAAGLEADGQSMEQARFLVEGGIPLTAENLRRLAAVRTVDYPVSEERVIRAAAAAIADGKSALQANLADTESAWKQAVYWKEQADAISDEAVRAVSEGGGELNLRSLSAAQRRIELRDAGAPDAVRRENGAQGKSGYDAVRGGDGPQDDGGYDAVKGANGPQNDGGYDAARGGDGPQNAGGYDAARGEKVPEGDEAYLTARRRLEELRLQMTVTANHSLIKKGYAIDTTELSQLVEALKAAEQQAKQTLFCGSNVQENTEREETFQHTLDARERLYMAPAALIGRMVQEGEGWTFEQTAEQGWSLKSLYEQADERYETMMTQPRRDLGDSIRKAFRNVDDIISDMGLAPSEANRRAVRILGYNRMEITPEQIEQVKDADLSVQRVIEKLTPASVLQMIREGRNPLDMTVAELEGYLGQKDRDPAQEQEKYGEFLYRLERADEITREEKESYIGIYRLFRQIEKSDGAVIGRLVDQGAGFTVKNLLAAVRTGRNKGIDAQIGDQYGALRELARKDIAIDDQIMSAYDAHVCEAVYDHLEPEALHTMDLNANPPLEELLRQLREGGEDPQVKEKAQERGRQYRSEALAEVREAADMQEENLRFLLDGRQPVTADYLAAACQMRTNRNQAFRSLFELAGEREEASVSQEGKQSGESGPDGGGDVEGAQERFLAAADRLKDSFTDAEQAGRAYASFTEAGMELLERRGVLAQGKELDIKAYRLIGRQLSLAAGLAREEQYRIPVEIDGQITAIDVKIRRQEAGQGHVSVTMEHEGFGKVGADLEMTSASSVSGYFAYGSAEGAEMSKTLERCLSDRLGGEQIQLKEFCSVYSDRLDPDRFGSGRAQPGSRQAGAAENAAAGTGKSRVPNSKLYRAARAFVAALQDTSREWKGAGTHEGKL